MEQIRSWGILTLLGEVGYFRRVRWRQPGLVLLGYLATCVCLSGSFSAKDGDQGRVPCCAGQALGLGWRSGSGARERMSKT